MKEKEKVEAGGIVYNLLSQVSLSRFDAARTLS